MTAQYSWGDVEPSDPNVGVSFVVTVGTDALVRALSASLAAVGLICVSRKQSRSGLRLAGALVVASDTDHVRDLVADFTMSRIPVVIMGSLRRPCPLIAAVGAGAATVVDADLPFVELLDVVVAALGTDAEVSADRQRLLRALRSRQHDQELLALLTRRERAVLRALAFGHTALEIAQDEQVSIATVRSHIHSILRKLDVSSQLAAVALARRGDRRLGLTDLLLIH